MHKLVLWLIVYLTFPFFALSQCIPNATLPASQQYSPSPEEGLKKGAVGLYYQSTLTVNVPSDSTYQGVNVRLDSIILTEVKGLPPDFTYACSKPRCVFFGGELGCISFSGITNDPEADKIWPLNAQFDFKLTYGFLPLSLVDSVTDYSIDLTLYPAQIASLDIDQYKFFQNLSSDFTELHFNLPYHSAYELKMYSMMGKTVHSFVGKSDGTLMNYQISKSSFSPGIYLATISQENYSRTIRIAVK